MLTREQGMGRNISELVSWVSNRCCHAAGDYHHSYWPQPVFLVMNPRTNKHYYLNAFHDEFSWLDFTNEKFHEIEFHIAKELKGRICKPHESCDMTVIRRVNVSILDHRQM